MFDPRLTEAKFSREPGIFSSRFIRAKTRKTNERSSMARFNFTSSREQRSWMEKIQGSRQSRDLARKRVHTNVRRHVYRHSVCFQGLKFRITVKRNPRFLRRPPPFPPPPSSYASCLSRASTYENYNFPDSTKVSWLSCRGRVLSLFRPFRTDLSRNPTWFTLLRLVAAQPSRDRSLTIVSLWKWATDTRLRDTFNHSPL